MHVNVFLNFFFFLFLVLPSIYFFESQILVQKILVSFAEHFSCFTFEYNIFACVFFLPRFSDIAIRSVLPISIRPQFFFLSLVFRLIFHSSFNTLVHFAFFAHIFYSINTRTFRMLSRAHHRIIKILYTFLLSVVRLCS